jgi:hypothetical protein
VLLIPARDSIMTLDDLRRLFSSPTLFRLDTILSPKLVPLLYLVGLMAILLWAVSHLFWTFGTNFGNGLWGLLEIVIFGMLWLTLLRIGCEALLVFFRAHEAAAESLSRTRLPTSLLDEVGDAIHDLAEDADDLTPPMDPAPSVIRPSDPMMPPDVPVRGPTVRRSAKRTPPTEPKV